MVLPRRRMAVTSKGVWTARSGSGEQRSTAITVVGRQEITIQRRTSSRDQREMKERTMLYRGAFFCHGVDILTNCGWQKWSWCTVRRTARR